MSNSKSVSKWSLVNPKGTIIILSHLFSYYSNVFIVLGPIHSKNPTLLYQDTLCGYFLPNLFIIDSAVDAISNGY